MTDAETDHITPGDHQGAMRMALVLAAKSPCIPTNYRVGALITHSATGRIVATGYTLELPGNTHAEECCLLKVAGSLAASEPSEPLLTSTSTSSSPARADDDATIPQLPVPRPFPTEPHTLYTTVEPCCLRLSGKTACLERVLRQKAWIRTVCYGFREPHVFVVANSGLDELRAQGVEVVHVEGMEEDIRTVAMEGHRAGAGV